MAFEARDPAYLWDMLEAARSIQQFTAGVSSDEYLENRVMQLAVERQVEVIGEAARMCRAHSNRLNLKYRGSQ